MEYGWGVAPRHHLAFTRLFSRTARAEFVPFRGLCRARQRTSGTAQANRSTCDRQGFPGDNLLWSPLTITNSWDFQAEVALCGQVISADHRRAQEIPVEHSDAPTRGCRALFRISGLIRNSIPKG